MKSQIGILGGSFKFYDFLNKSVGGNSKIRRFFSIENAVDASEKGDVSVLFILPDYEKGKTILDEFDIGILERLSALRAQIHQRVKNNDFKLYIENYPSYSRNSNALFGIKDANCRKIKYFNDEYICTSESLTPKIGASLLQTRKGFYFSGKPISFSVTSAGSEILLQIKNCIGTHNPIREEEENLGIALIRSDGFYSAYFSLSQYDGTFMLPYARWMKLYGVIFSDILGVEGADVENAFDLVYSESKICISYKTQTIQKEGLEEALRQSIENVIQWHFDAGMFPEPSGRYGVYEMIESGSLELAKNKRVDTSFFTAVLFMKAGLYFKRDDWYGIGKNVLDDIYDVCKCQFETGPNEGIIKWFVDYYGIGTHLIFSSDNGRCGLNILEAYEITGDKKYLKGAISLGDAFLRWFGGQALLSNGCYDYTKMDIKKCQQIKNNCDSPEYYEAPAIFLKQLYQHTGDIRYRDQLIKTADELIFRFPVYGKGPSHSTNFTYSRLLGVVCTAHSCVPSDTYCTIINKLLDYFMNLRHESGGIADGIAYVPEDWKNDMEFAVGFGPGKDKIADTMYCCNTLLTALTIIKNSRYVDKIDMQSVEILYNGLVNFYLNIQIKSIDKRINGGWMRAFDMENEEYYGCHKDIGWGPYCIIGGWVMGAVPLMFLQMLGEGSLYY